MQFLPSKSRVRSGNRRGLFVAFALWASCLPWTPGCDRSRDDDGAEAARRAAARRRLERLADARIDAPLGVERAAVLVTRYDLSDERAFTRDDAVDRASRPGAVVTVVTLLAGLRSGLVTPATRHACNGYACWRAHGEVGPADALAESCNGFFEDLAARLGAAPLGAAFASLGLGVPPLPDERAQRSRLATRAEGWTLSPRGALRLARAMVERPAPWPAPLDEALVPRVGDPGPLRGKVAWDDEDGWFVGYTSAAEGRLVVARVSGCSGACGVAALRAARWGLERVRPPVVAPARGPMPPSPRRRR